VLAAPYPNEVIAEVYAPVGAAAQKKTPPSCYSASLQGRRSLVAHGYFGDPHMQG